MHTGFSNKMYHDCCLAVDVESMDTNTNKGKKDFKFIDFEEIVTLTHNFFISKNCIFQSNDDIWIRWFTHLLLSYDNFERNREDPKPD